MTRLIYTPLKRELDIEFEIEALSRTNILKYIYEPHHEIHLGCFKDVVEFIDNFTRLFYLRHGYDIYYYDSENDIIPIESEEEFIAYLKSKQCPTIHVYEVTKGGKRFGGVFQSQSPAPNFIDILKIPRKFPKDTAKLVNTAPPSPRAAMCRIKLQGKEYRSWLRPRPKSNHNPPLLPRGYTLETKKFIKKKRDFWDEFFSTCREEKINTRDPLPAMIQNELASSFTRLKEEAPRWFKKEMKKFKEELKADLESAVAVESKHLKSTLKKDMQKKFKQTKDSEMSRHSKKDSKSKKKEVLEEAQIGNKSISPKPSLQKLTVDISEDSDENFTNDPNGSKFFDSLNKPEGRGAEAGLLIESVKLTSSNFSGETENINADKNLASVSKYKSPKLRKSTKKRKSKSSKRQSDEEIKAESPKVEETELELGDEDTLADNSGICNSNEDCEPESEIIEEAEYHFIDPCEQDSMGKSTCKDKEDNALSNTSSEKDPSDMVILDYISSLDDWSGSNLSLNSDEMPDKQVVERNGQQCEVMTMALPSCFVLEAPLDEKKDIPLLLKTKDQSKSEKQNKKNRKDSALNNTDAQKNSNSQDYVVVKNTSSKITHSSTGEFMDIYRVDCDGVCYFQQDDQEFAGTSNPSGGFNTSGDPESVQPKPIDFSSYTFRNEIVFSVDNNGICFYSRQKKQTVGSDKPIKGNIQTDNAYMMDGKGTCFSHQTFEKVKHFNDKLFSTNYDCFSKKNLPGRNFNLLATLPSRTLKNQNGIKSCKKSNKVLKTEPNAWKNYIHISDGSDDSDFETCNVSDSSSLKSVKSGNDLSSSFTSKVHLNEYEESSETLSEMKTTDSEGSHDLETLSDEDFSIVGDTIIFFNKEKDITSAKESAKVAKESANKGVNTDSEASLDVNSLSNKNFSFVKSEDGEIRCILAKDFLSQLNSESGKKEVNKNQNSSSAAGSFIPPEALLSEIDKFSESIFSADSFRSQNQMINTDAKTNSSVPLSAGNITQNSKPLITSTSDNLFSKVPKESFLPFPNNQSFTPFLGPAPSCLPQDNISDPPHPFRKVRNSQNQTSSADAKVAASSSLPSDNGNSKPVFTSPIENDQYNGLSATGFPPSLNNQSLPLNMGLSLSSQYNFSDPMHPVPNTLNSQPALNFFSKPASLAPLHPLQPLPPLPTLPSLPGTNSSHYSLPQSTCYGPPHPYSMSKQFNASPCNPILNQEIHFPANTNPYYSSQCNSSAQFCQTSGNQRKPEPYYVPMPSGFGYPNSPQINNFPPKLEHSYLPFGANMYPNSQRSHNAHGKQEPSYPVNPGVSNTIPQQNNNFVGKREAAYPTFQQSNFVGKREAFYPTSQQNNNNLRKQESQYNSFMTNAFSGPHQIQSVPGKQGSFYQSSNPNYYPNFNQSLHPHAFPPVVTPNAVSNPSQNTSTSKARADDIFNDLLPNPTETQSLINDVKDGVNKERITNCSDETTASHEKEVDKNDRFFAEVAKNVGSPIVQIVPERIIKTFSSAAACMKEVFLPNQPSHDSADHASEAEAIEKVVSDVPLSPANTSVNSANPSTDSANVSSAAKKRHSTQSDRNYIDLMPSLGPRVTEESSFEMKMSFLLGAGFGREEYVRRVLSENEGNLSDTLDTLLA